MTSHERAVEVDTRLADLYDQYGTAAMRIDQDLDSLHRHDGQRRGFSRQAWEVSNEDTEASVRAKLTDQSSSFWAVSPGYRDDQPFLIHTGQYAQSTLEDLDANRAKLAEIAEAERPLHAEYDADPWPRFFLVLNTGGHIHRTRNCVTTFPTTRWGWLPNLSGLTEEDAVKDQGPRLCSVCYPSAPVEWTLGLPKAPKCPGSGQRVQRIGRSSYGSCPVCHKSYKLSEVGLIRAHKPA